tara:strand:+ start:5603 stop:6466 length:864 start_codon:yes stop_codon:yes gene_type:complete
MTTYLEGDELENVVAGLPEATICKKVMKLLFKRQIEQRTEDWYEQRDAILTASDCATAIGKNPYGKNPRRQLIMKKAKVKGNGMDPHMARAVEHGQKYEDEAFQIYMCQNPHLAPFFKVGLVMHDKHRFLGASPDGVTKDGIVIEIKCPISRQITNEVPPVYIPQVQLQMECLDLDVCHFVQYRPRRSEFEPMEMQMTVVHRDREWFQTYLPLMQKFISDLELFKEQYTAYLRVLLPEEYEEPKKQTPKKRKFDEFMICDNDCVPNGKTISDEELTSQNVLVMEYVK